MSSVPGRIIPYEERPAHWPESKWREYRYRIVESFDFFEVPQDEQQEILVCLHDDISWDWYRDCDGCTAVSEPGWPSRYYPPCIRHDYDWQTGNGGWKSNARFLRLNKKYRMEGWRANIRWLGVTVAWYSWFKWYNIMAGSRSKRRKRR